MKLEEIKALIERARIASVSVDTNDGGRKLFFHLAEEMEKLVAVAEAAKAENATLWCVYDAARNAISRWELQHYVMRSLQNALAALPPRDEKGEQDG